MRRALLLAVLLAAAAAVGFAYFRGRPDRLVLAGTIEARTALVGSLVGGRIVTVHVREGDHSGLAARRGAGKILPYLVLAFAQLIFILLLMRWVFRVPIHGSVPLLLGLSVVYLFSLLSLGLLVSSRSTTQMEAMQMAQMFLLPSIMLSGYIFPLSSLPVPLRVVAQLLPATHFIAISRGIVIRGAAFLDL